MTERKAVMGEEHAVFGQVYERPEAVFAGETAELAFDWRTGIGLQDVDHLKTDACLLEIAGEVISGRLSFAQAEQQIAAFYRSSEVPSPERTEEADRVALRIAACLSEKAFRFSTEHFLALHRQLFQGIYDHAGRIRDTNITKREWILGGDTVTYTPAGEVKATLEYDFAQERSFSYTALGMTEVIRHLARFTAGLWQIHPFYEGNTRTTAVFLIQYLRYLGFRKLHDTFGQHSWYFRNALVRASVYDDTTFLELFLRNLLLGEAHILKNRYMHIDWWRKEEGKTTFPDTETRIQALVESGALRRSTADNMMLLHRNVGEDVFGRKDVMRYVRVTESPAAVLLRKMQDLALVERVVGLGRGRYRFISRSL
ncbi:MAG: Fic family protein [Clostridia bacterium]|nr:Fic family protein [Clostridia bacterium]